MQPEFQRVTACADRLRGESERLLAEVGAQDNQIKSGRAIRRPRDTVRDTRVANGMADYAGNLQQAVRECRQDRPGEPETVAEAKAACDKFGDELATIQHSDQQQHYRGDAERFSKPRVGARSAFRQAMCGAARQPASKNVLDEVDHTLGGVVASAGDAVGASADEAPRPPEMQKQSRRRLVSTEGRGERVAKEKTAPKSDGETRRSGPL